MSIMEMEEIKNAITGVESKVEYNGGGIETLLSNALLNAGSVVKSVQRGLRTNVTDGITRNEHFDINISAIDTNKSILIADFVSAPNNSIREEYFSIELQSNKIRVTDVTPTSGSYLQIALSWQVIEFY